MEHRIKRQELWGLSLAWSNFKGLIHLSHLRDSSDFLKCSSVKFYEQQVAYMVWITLCNSLCLKK